jgi:hypothetical protein
MASGQAQQLSSLAFILSTVGIKLLSQSFLYGTLKQKKYQKMI